jgi:hypothetical protein
MRWLETEEEALAWLAELAGKPPAA